MQSQHLPQRHDCAKKLGLILPTSKSFQSRRRLLQAGVAAGFGLGLAQGADAAQSASKPPPQGEAQRPRLHIMLDPGHAPQQGGATGARGITEVHYNDAFAGLLAAALQAQGHRVSLTRTPQQDISLEQRAALANASGADLFLAIHHDSAQVQYLEKVEVNQQTAWRTKQPIQGFSVFVSQNNPRFAESLGYAKTIASALKTTGRTPTLHHAENIPGENRELLDAALGVYRFDGLLVLRKTTMPAVLLEVGVIVDAADEARVTDPQQRSRMVAAIVQALN